MSAEVQTSALHVNHRIINERRLLWGRAFSASDSGSSCSGSSMDESRTSTGSAELGALNLSTRASESSASEDQRLEESLGASLTTSPSPVHKKSRSSAGSSVGSEGFDLPDWDSVISDRNHSGSPAISTSSDSNRDTGTPSSRISDTSTSITDISQLFGQLKENGIRRGTLPMDNHVDLEELEDFAKTFKQKRIQLGFTQHDVGGAMGRLYKNDFSQTTISRFEALNLSFKNMCKLKPLLQKWLAETEEAVVNGKAEKKVPICSSDRKGEMRAAVGTLSAQFPGAGRSSEAAESVADRRRRKKRTSIEARLRVLLEEAFQENQRPNSDELDALALKLNMEREVIRVWFCNRRQKERRLQTIGCLNADGSADIQQLINGAAPGLLLYTHSSELPGYTTIPSKVSLKVNQDEALNQSVKTVVVEEAEGREGGDQGS